MTSTPGADAPRQSPVSVSRPHLAAAIDRGGGVRTWHLVPPGLGGSSFVSGITEFDPGSSLPWHFHNCDESVTVIAGEAAFDVEGLEYRLEPDDSTLVRAEAPHRFRNDGDDRLRILWVYGSNAPTRTLVETGESFAIGSPDELAALRGREELPAEDAGRSLIHVRALHHVGVVVKDLEAVRNFMENVLGLQPAGGVSRADLVTVFYPAGQAQIELIRPTETETLNARLRGDAVRLEHLALEVADLEDVLVRLQEIGVSATAPPRSSAGGLTFWTEPSTSFGLPLQFIQPAEAGSE